MPELTRRRRRGFTLIEMLIGIVLVGIVGMALTRVVTSTQRISQAQTQKSEMQGAVRAGALILPAEMREIGYDVNNLGTVVTDIVDAQATSIQFRAMRGWAVMCGNYDPTGIYIHRDVIGYRAPAVDDQFLLFVENDHAMGSDDEWVPFTVDEVQPNMNCGAEPALRLRTPVAPALFQRTVPITQPDGTVLTAGIDAGGMPNPIRILNGSPIRYAEVMEYGLYADATNRWYLGAREVPLVGAKPAWEPVIGPLRNANGVSFAYRDRNNAVVPAGDPTRYQDIRMIEITFRGETRSVVSRFGTGSRQIARDSLVARVALRNNLRP
jgi:prepilin-type N-terminal cleavage/methylation domain-containing protein